MDQNSSHRHHRVNRSCHHTGRAELYGRLHLMSMAILTSCQYQNHRLVNLIVVHCSATRCDRSYTPADCRRDHLARGFADIGYHFYITRDGMVHACRPLHQEGAHAIGFNKYSIGICYEGGLDSLGTPADTRTEAQRHTLQALLLRLRTDYPRARIVGHNVLNPHKACPCFDVEREYGEL